MPTSRTQGPRDDVTASPIPVITSAAIFQSFVRPINRFRQNGSSYGSIHSSDSDHDRIPHFEAHLDLAAALVTITLDLPRMALRLATPTPAVHQHRHPITVDLSHDHAPSDRLERRLRHSVTVITNSRAGRFV